MTLLTRLAAALVAFASLIVPALADDWKAVKLRGQVFALADSQWQELNRGDVVSDSRYIRTGANGYAVFQRGEETITLWADTQVQIFDQSGRQFTTVNQTAGKVAIEAEVKNVQHFAVQTQLLAAVVKGTKFTVEVGASGDSVEVERGHVQVEDQHTHNSVLLAKRQSAHVIVVAGKSDLEVSGSGKLPAVVDATGIPIEDQAVLTDAEIKALEKAAKDAAKLADEAAKAAAKAAEDASKAEAKAAKDPGKAASEAAKAAEKAARDAQKAAEKAAKAAEKAANDAEKAARDALKAKGKKGKG